MDAVTYPDATVQETLTKHAVPVKIGMWEDRDAAKKLKALWTPNFIHLDPEGNEWHRDLGFLPPKEWTARFLVGAGIYYMQKRALEKSSACFEEVVAEYPDTHEAPGARYFQGVVGMRMSKAVAPIYDACKDVLEMWPDSLWAKKLAFTTKYDSFDEVGRG